ncbi:MULTISPECIES: hypothetical protein [unclassified Streptomyces]|uniref:hypothetical protein n=1 Tax=unclassified Streptomyces TaxID=2593676 RepID=UPI00382CB48C
MTESNAGFTTGTDKDLQAEADAVRARHTTDRATAPASRAVRTAAGKVDEAASAAKSGVERSADATSAAAHGAARRVEAGRRAVVATSGRVAASARTAWTAVAARKLVAAGVGVGVTALTAASYAVGRRSGRRSLGPITRLTGGRI